MFIRSAICVLVMPCLRISSAIPRNHACNRRRLRRVVNALLIQKVIERRSPMLVFPGHVAISFIRLRANSTSSCGVFCVFLIDKTVHTQRQSVLYARKTVSGRYGGSISCCTFPITRPQESGTSASSCYAKVPPPLKHFFVLFELKKWVRNDRGF